MAFFSRFKRSPQPTDVYVHELNQGLATLDEFLLTGLGLMTPGWDDEEQLINTFKWWQNQLPIVLQNWSGLWTRPPSDKSLIRFHNLILRIMRISVDEQQQSFQMIETQSNRDLKGYRAAFKNGESATRKLDGLTPRLEQALKELAHTHPSVAMTLVVPNILRQQ